MFEAQEGARLFHLPPGCDFASRFLDGLSQRLAPLDPLARARVRVVVNTRRAGRVLTEKMVQDPRFAGFLPQVLVLGDLQDATGLPEAVSETRRMFWIARLVAGLLDREPDLAPMAARFDLARALGTLLDELQEADVPPEALAELPVAEMAAHWQTSMRFIELLSEAWPRMREEAERGAPDPAARSHHALEAMLSRWEQAPPTDPVIIAGSTGSRVGTYRLMKAVASLPQGAVVLPGYDANVPHALLQDGKLGPDHPQYGLIRLSAALDVEDPPIWSECSSPRARAHLVSTSLRPAPVTDEWLAAAPALSRDVGDALEGLSWLEAPAPREEAEAIAFAIREAVEEGKSVALVTPDRALSRRVAAALDRWRIVPDDSAGRPLHLTPPGVLLRLVARDLGGEMPPAHLLELLKHPLVGGQGEARRLHLRRVGRLETHRDVLGTAAVDWERLGRWAEEQFDTDTPAWLEGLRVALSPLRQGGQGDCAAGLDLIRRVAESLSPAPDGRPSPLWQAAAGEAALATFEALHAASTAAGSMSDAEIAGVLDAQIANEPVRREGYVARPGVAILGALEARMQQADLMILGGLNEATWPARPRPDPWINREMRARLGLPLPEREIGLAAHDYQTAVTAPRVLVTRAMRTDGAPTVASRWLIRLENLVEGLGADGKAALAAAKSRGTAFLRAAAALDVPDGDWPQPMPRTAPAPPLAARPRALAVTRIETLIRDPYAIYAQKVLGLYELPTAGQVSDAMLRGNVLHDVMEEWVAALGDDPDTDMRALLERIADAVLARKVESATHRLLWHARLIQIADTLCEHEAARQEGVAKSHFEIRGSHRFADIDFTLEAKADRIDMMEDGRARIYDYKSGQPPTVSQMRKFALQLPLEKLLAESGAFKPLRKPLVERVAYLGLNSSVSITALERDDDELAEIATRFPALIMAYDDEAKGYSPRSRPAFVKDYETVYDLVTRYGEWGDETDAKIVEVGR